jgi:hypothetical protein
MNLTSLLIFFNILKHIRIEGELNHIDKFQEAFTVTVKTEKFSRDYNND